jgi:hypothetical protein
MASVQKTTLYLDPDEYDRIKDIARAQGRRPAELLREAVAQYAERNGPRRKPTSIGAGRSKRGDVAERAQELLEGMGSKGDRR